MLHRDFFGRVSLSKMAQIYVRQNITALTLSLLLVATVGLYWETSWGLFAYWLDDRNYTYSHGWLLLLVSIYLVYERWRTQAQPLDLAPSWVGGVVVIISSMVWLMATIGSIQVVQFLSFVGLVSGVFWGVMGFSQARLFALPILLILGALPLWDSVATVLQLPTTLAAEWMLQISRVPVLREGFFLSVPAGDFEVEAACSGLHYILVAVLLGLIFCAMHRLHWWVTIGIILAAATISIVANFIRVYTVILIGQYTNMESDLVKDHASVGWVVFALGAIPLFWFASKLTKQDKYVGGIKVAPVVKQGRLSRSVGVVTLLAGLLVGPVWMGYLEAQIEEAMLNESEFPVIIKSASRGELNIEYQPAFMPGDVVKEGWIDSERSGEASTYLYLSRFYRQKQGKEAVSSSNRLVSSSSLWNQLEAGSIPFQGLSGGVVNVATLSSGNIELRVWQWYQVGERRITNPLWAKIYNVIATLQGHGYIDVVVLATKIEDDVAAADVVLQRFSKKYLKK